ncbi:MAG: hypothetical protein EA397_17675 [Deltaproteobacteria bacterium]|nr:MAG: hypothetical protein EA397_17675 [Deltaproteobacteria bacterium]
MVEHGWHERALDFYVTDFDHRPLRRRTPQLRVGEIESPDGGSAADGDGELPAEDGAAPTCLSGAGAGASPEELDDSGGASMCTSTAGESERSQPSTRPKIQICPKHLMDDIALFQGTRDLTDEAPPRRCLR